MATRPPITCHALDTTTGKPAVGIAVTLTLVSPLQSQSIQYTATTDNDGRVAAWQSTSHVTDLHTTFEAIEGEIKWEIYFGTGQYWEQRGINPFFPEVEIKFLTTGFKGLALKDGEKPPHWHVPLLLGPYTYTTYRGS